MVATLHLATWACFILISKVASVRVEDQWPDLKLVINSNKFYTKLCVHWVWCSGDLGSGLVVSFFPPWCGHPSIVFGVYSGWCHAAAAFLERWQRDGVFVLSPHRLNQHDALWPTPNIIHGHGIRFSCVCVWSSKRSPRPTHKRSPTLLRKPLQRLLLSMTDAQFKNWTDVLVVIGGADRDTLNSRLFNNLFAIWNVFIPMRGDSLSWHFLSDGLSNFWWGNCADEPICKTPLLESAFSRIFFFALKKETCVGGWLFISRLSWVPARDCNQPAIPIRFAISCW